ncbi:ribosomal biogenesis factor-like isoform X2 [Mustela nigripes]|uniref:ribosomal biogenesis factor-like isoform X2 n=1 Tax=Mustela lutreola TaxID=9666 RepID=UPI00279744E6|nr:ribosomal biogenesis factor-like isoform X2 [Mustela lutreola]XP_059244030.1 ribosomal biogenesis factor-like isoform X2 [Mustela nigripes]
MAKNKLRGQKSRNVFHIASQKNYKTKNKAKPVITNLKKINTVSDEKPVNVDEATRLMSQL